MNEWRMRAQSENRIMELVGQRSEENLKINCSQRIITQIQVARQWSTTRMEVMAMMALMRREQRRQPQQAKRQKWIRLASAKIYWKKCSQRTANVIKERWRHRTPDTEADLSIMSNLSTWIKVCAASAPSSMKNWETPRKWRTPKRCIPTLRQHLPIECKRCKT